MTDFNALLTELAHARQHRDRRNKMAQQMAEHFHAMYIAPYELEIANNNQRVSDLEEQIRALALEEVQATGDTSLHPHLTFRRETKLVYDKDEVIQWVQTKGLTHYLRIKPAELDVRAFEKAVRDGLLPDADVEKVNHPAFNISAKLGDLLIIEELHEQG